MVRLREIKSPWHVITLKRRVVPLGETSLSMSQVLASVAKGKHILLDANVSGSLKLRIQCDWQPTETEGEDSFDVSTSVDDKRRTSTNHEGMTNKKAQCEKTLNEHRNAITNRALFSSTANACEASVDLPVASPKGTPVSNSATRDSSQPPTFMLTSKTVLMKKSTHPESSSNSSASSTPKSTPPQDVKTLNVDQTTFQEQKFTPLSPGRLPRFGHVYNRQLAHSLMTLPTNNIGVPSKACQDSRLPSLSKTKSEQFLKMNSKHVEETPSAAASSTLTDFNEHQPSSPSLSSSLSSMDSYQSEQGQSEMTRTRKQEKLESTKIILADLLHSLQDYRGQYETLSSLYASVDVLMKHLNGKPEKDEPNELLLSSPEPENEESTSDKEEIENALAEFDFLDESDEQPSKSSTPQQYYFDGTSQKKVQKVVEASDREKKDELQKKRVSFKVASRF